MRMKPALAATTVALATMCAGQTALAQSWPIGSIANNFATDNAQLNFCSLAIGPSSFVLPTKGHPGLLSVPQFQTGVNCTPSNPCVGSAPSLTWAGAAHLAFGTGTSGALIFDYYNNQGYTQGTPSIIFTNYNASYNKTTSALTVSMTLTPSTSACSVNFQGTYYKP
jgi:hypothetical protein